ncbi:MAG TPA: GPP34 family phosphoprotein [Pseudonocardiaceae bacterium]|nr:GPP34 family phosphoprotein [Pseudonocardiaceae bacterium]
MRPASPLWLADEFYLSAHRDYDGRPRLNTPALALGLAGALLAELAMHRRIKVDPQQLELTVVNPDPPPDATAHAVLDQLMGEPAITSISTWLQYLGRSAGQRVAERLVRARVVRPVITGPVWRKSTLHPPMDANDAMFPSVRVTGMAVRGLPIDLPDALLVGLAAATGLDRFMLQDIDAAGRQHLRAEVDRLPRPLWCLLVETKAAVGIAAVNRRR